MSGWEVTKLKLKPETAQTLLAALAKRGKGEGRNISDFLDAGDRIREEVKKTKKPDAKAIADGLADTLKIGDKERRAFTTEMIGWLGRTKNAPFVRPKNESGGWDWTKTDPSNPLNYILDEYGPYGERYGTIRSNLAKAGATPLNVEAIIPKEVLRTAFGGALGVSDMVIVTFMTKEKDGSLTPGMGVASYDSHLSDAPEESRESERVAKSSEVQAEALKTITDEAVEEILRGQSAVRNRMSEWADSIARKNGWTSKGTKVEMKVSDEGPRERRIDISMAASMSSVKTVMDAWARRQAEAARRIR